MDGAFPIRPRRGTVIVYDDQPETLDGGVATSLPLGCIHLDFPVVAMHPEDAPGFGVGSVVVLDDPNAAGDMDHRRMLDGVVYRAVPLEHVIAVKE